MALQAVGLEAEACFVTNVGDDIDIDGLLVCPDTDAVVYALAGRFDEDRGWGIRGDEFPPDRQGEMPWFNLGRRDRRHHERRRALLESGMGLAAATGQLCLELEVVAGVVPVTDDRVRTVVETDAGPLGWQEWIVRERAAPEVRRVRYEGAVDARADPTALAAVVGAALLLIAPSSPVASLGPTLAVPGVAAAIRSRTGPTVALSPVAGRRPLRSDRDRHRAAARARLMAAIGLAHDAPGAAAFYRGLVDQFVVDAADKADLPAIRAQGGEAWCAPIVEVAELTALLGGRLDPRGLNAPGG
jgi:LPPG:FO 2-phospho-L-lactate transferase